MTTADELVGSALVGIWCLPCLPFGCVVYGHKMICDWLLTVLGFEVPGRGYALIRGWLPLVLALGSLARGGGHAEAICSLFWVCKPLRVFKKVCHTAETGYFCGRDTERGLGRVGEWVTWGLRITGTGP